MPRRRDWRAPVLALLAVGLIRLAGGRLAWFLLDTLLLMLAGAALWAWCLRRCLRVQVQTREHALHVGAAFTLQVTVHNAGPCPAPWLEVDQQTPAARADDPHPLAATALARGEQQVLTFTARALRRGHYRPGPVRIRSGDGFGIFVTEQAQWADHPVTVLPPVKPVRGLLPAAGQPEGRQTRPWSPPAAGTVGGVRAHQPSDGMRHIHWPTSARRGALFVKLPERTVTQALWVVLDLSAETWRLAAAARARSAGTGGPAAGSYDPLEAAVVAAAGLAGHALAQGQEVGLVAAGAERTRIPAGRGRRTLAQILAALAVAQPGDERPFADVLGALPGQVPPRAAICAITPAVTTAVAGALAALAARQRLLLIVPEVAGAADLLPLARRGIQTYRLAAADDPERRPEVRLRPVAAPPGQVVGE